MLWLALLVACDGDPGETDDTEAGTEAPAAAFELAEDPDCEAFTDESGEKTPIAGATNFWIGELVFSGEDVTGYEQRVMFANDAWVEAVPEADDCRVTWQITGVKTADGACGSCDYRLQLHATLDRTETTCIDEFVDFEPVDQEIVYDVAVTGEGAVTLYFESGAAFATVGGAGEAGLWYQSDATCKWF